MKKIFYLFVSLCFVSLLAMSQNATPFPNSEYSRWSIGVNVGSPFYWGDFKSFSADKDYYGLDGGLQLTYQVSSLLGITFSGDYGTNKTGNRAYAKNYLLDKKGYTYYTPQSATTATYGTLYGKTRHLSLGLGVDINLLRLLTSNPNRRFAILLTPTAWVQKFSSDIYKLSDDSKFTDGSMEQSWHMALGGSLSLRYRASKTIDLQLKNTFAYIYNNKFDGIETDLVTRQNYMWIPQLGIVFKLGNTQKSGKIDNMLYYGKREAPAPVVEPQTEPAKEEAVVIAEQPKPEPQKEEPQPIVEKAKEEIPTLPILYFSFNRWDIQTETQADDLRTIVETVGKFADCPIILKGYGDHRGSNLANKHVSQKRADAVRKYLINQGIDGNRISAEGCGKDVSVADKEARRVEIHLINKE
jgi:outer membrane protein OmpA-like peptidoglycan-associated protein